MTLTRLGRHSWFTSSLLMLVLSLTGGNAEAKPPAKGSGAGPLGIGVILGEPTGLTGKFWRDGSSAYDLGIAWSFNDFLLIYGDILFHWSELPLRTSRDREFRPYIGGGLVLLISTEDNRKDERYFTDDGSVGLGFRVPLGIEWRPRDVPVGVFGELVPGIGLVPSTFGFIQGGIGIRYYF